MPLVKISTLLHSAVNLQFATKWPLKISHTLKRVTSLPCEMFVFKSSLTNSTVTAVYMGSSLTNSTVTAVYMGSSLTNSTVTAVYMGSDWQTCGLM